jgi:phosphoglycolate/pyridoxal phosphate phosphatase family enzyme
VLLDQDGVLFHGSKPIPGALETVGRLRDAGKTVLFITNNSGLSRASVAARLRDRGVEGVSTEDVVTAGSASAAFLLSRALTSAFVVGEPGLIEELSSASITCQSVCDTELARMSDDDFSALFHDCTPRPDAVVVGLDSSFTYRKLALASAFVQRGALLVGTNPDAGDRIGAGLAPGAGAIIAAVETASGCQATVVGKPDPSIISSLLSLRGLRAEETLFVGDRLDTDVLCGSLAGVATCLVLTGVASLQDAEKATGKHRPTFVLPSLMHLS